MLFSCFMQQVRWHGSGDTWPDTIAPNTLTFMGNLLRTKDLSKIGYTNDKARSLAINIFSKHFKHHSKQEQLTLLQSISTDPAHYKEDAVIGKIAQVFMGETEGQRFKSYDLLAEPVPLKTYGGKDIEGLAKRQMELSAILPVSIQAALMPDAHAGYGLPIGGVLATDNAVIPYAVGMDIGCRMALSVLDASDSYLKRYAFQIKRSLKDFTHFGMEGGLDFRQEHEVLDRALFKDMPFLKQLHGKAYRQLGSSGSGNHFVEFGTVELFDDNSLGLPAGKFTAILSHSGSRGLGAAIAKRYTHIAMDSCKLPRQAQQLAWLDMNTEAGAEYWACMNLAGDYAKACHDRIHQNLTKALGLEVLSRVENHHNFAWREVVNGIDAIVHRKGATPAHRNELGIIPGSMVSPAFLVKGKGAEASIFSASHGAGRAMSRQKARDTMTVSGMKKMLVNAGVSLIGGSVEENPGAYKDIEKVMAAQKDLVSVEGKFYPSIVRMNKE